MSLAEQLQQDPLRISALHGLGASLHAQGREEEALEFFKQADELGSKPNVAPEPVAQVRYALAEALLGLGGDAKTIMALAAAGREAFDKLAKEVASAQPSDAYDALERRIHRYARAKGHQRQ